MGGGDENRNATGQYARGAASFTQTQFFFLLLESHSRKKGQRDKEQQQKAIISKILSCYRGDRGS